MEREMSSPDADHSTEGSEEARQKRFSSRQRALEAIDVFLTHSPRTQSIQPVSPLKQAILPSKIEVGGGILKSDGPKDIIRFQNQIRQLQEELGREGKLRAEAESQVTTLREQLVAALEEIQGYEELLECVNKEKEDLEVEVDELKRSSTGSWARRSGSSPTWTRADSGPLVQFSTRTYVPDLNASSNSDLVFEADTSKDELEEAIRSRDVLQRRLASHSEGLAKQLARFLLARAFSVLHQHRSQTRSCKRMVQCLLSKGTRKLLILSWSFWIAFCALSLEGEEIVRAAKERRMVSGGSAVDRMHAKRTLLKIFQHLQHNVKIRSTQSLASAQLINQKCRVLKALVWFRFVEVVQLLKKQRTKLSRSTKKKRVPVLRRVIQIWWESILQTRIDFLESMSDQHTDSLIKEADAHRLEKQAAFEQMQQHRNETVRRVIQKMRHINLSKAFTFFCECVTSVRHVREVLVQVVSRLALRHQAAAFGRWVQNTEEIIFLRARIAKALGRWRTPQIERAWEAWLEHRTIVSQEAQKEQECRARRSRQIAASRRAAAKLMQAQVAAAFSCFYENVSILKQQRNLLTKVLFNMTNRILRTYTIRWYESVKCMEHQRSLLKKVVAQMSNRLLASSLATWCVNAEEFRWTRLKLSAAVARWRRPRIERAWNAWWECIELEQADQEEMAFQEEQRLRKERQLETARRAAGRMFMGHLASAFGRLCEAIANRNRMRSICKRVLLQMANRCVSIAWRQWSETVEILQMQRSVCGKVIAKFINKQLATAFSRWSESLCYLADRREQIGHATRRWKHSVACQAFAAWCHFLELERQMAVEVALSERIVEMQGLVEEKEADLKAERLRNAEEIQNCMEYMERSHQNKMMEEKEATKEGVEAAFEHAQERHSAASHRMVKELCKEQLRSAFRSFAGATQNSHQQSTRVHRFHDRKNFHRLRSALELFQSAVYLSGFGFLSGGYSQLPLSTLALGHRLKGFMSSRSKRLKLERAFVAIMEFRTFSKGVRDRKQENLSVEANWEGPAGNNGSSAPLSSSSTIALCHFSLWKLLVKQSKWSSIKRCLPDVLPRVGAKH